jgi:hypothetical protein
MKDTLLSKISLLADENIPIKLINLLSKDNFNIKRVELGSKDKEIFDYAKSEKRALLTLDKHFLDKKKFPPQESSGIIFIQINPPLIDSIYFSLKRFFNSVKVSEFNNRLLLVSISGFRAYPKLVNRD